MNRRDTIIVAVLINACLLVVLFATSITKKEKVSPALPHEVPFTSSQKINFEDVQRTLVKETNTLEDSFPLQSALASQGQVEAKALAPIAAKEAEVKHAEPINTLNITVKSGDYLEKIARENNCAVSEIMSLNQLKNTQLKIGQVLKVPLKESDGSNAKTPLKQYIVKVGDTPWKIASDHNMNIEELLKLNHLDKETSRHLKPGDTLYIR